MPQLNPGGKYVYGWSRVNSDMKLCLPPELVKEYGLNDTEDIVILMSSSKTSGGFCVTSMKRGLQPGSWPVRSCRHRSGRGR